MKENQKIKTYEELLSKITYNVEDLGKSTFTSGNAYKITIKYNKKQFTFTFNDNYYNNSNLNDYIQCLRIDSSCYEETQNLNDFIISFYGDVESLEDYKQKEKIYNACKRSYNALNRLFNSEELELIYNVEY